MSKSLSWYICWWGWMLWISSGSIGWLSLFVTVTQISSSSSSSSNDNKDCVWNLCVTLRDTSDVTYRKASKDSWTSWLYPKAFAELTINDANTKALLVYYSTSVTDVQNCNGVGCPNPQWYETTCLPYSAPYNRSRTYSVGLKLFDVRNTTNMVTLVNEVIPDIGLLLSTDNDNTRVDSYLPLKNSSTIQFKTAGGFFYSLYLTSQLCVDIKKGSLAFSRNYKIKTTIEVSHGEDVVSWGRPKFGNKPTFNVSLCGYGTGERVLVDFFDSDASKQITLNIEEEDGNSAVSVEGYGLLNVTISNADCNSDDGFAAIVRRIVTVSYSILITLSSIAFLTACAAAYASFKFYPSSDPVNYFAVVWLVLDTWDFYSDIAFCWLLSSRAITRGLFVVSILILIFSYMGKMFYMVHLLQVWNNPQAPRQTRHWLEQWSWLLICLSMLLGGINPGLELCNSVLFPIEIFGMHLPFSEMVRVRTERFVTNVITENLPSLMIQLIYFFVAPYSQSQIIFYGTLVSSSLSFLFSATYYFAHRSSLSSTAVYRFSFRIQSYELTEYMSHAHWKIQTAIQEVLHLNTPTSVVLDQCTMSRGEDQVGVMRVEGRILSETINNKSLLKLRDGDGIDGTTETRMRFSVINTLLTQENNDTNEQIAVSLLTALRHQLSLGRNPDMQSWKIVPLNPPESVYDRKTEVQRCCSQLLFDSKLICRCMCQCCCPQCLKKLENMKNLSEKPLSSPMEKDRTIDEMEEGKPNMIASPSMDSVSIKPPSVLPTVLPKKPVSMQQLPSFSSAVSPIDNHIYVIHDQHSNRNLNTPQLKHRTSSDGDTYIPPKNLIKPPVPPIESRGLPALDLAQVKPPTQRRSLVVRNPPAAVTTAERKAFFEQLNKKKSEGNVISPSTPQKPFQYSKTNLLADERKKPSGLSVNQLFPDQKQQ